MRKIRGNLQRLALVLPEPRRIRCEGEKIKKWGWSGDSFNPSLTPESGKWGKGISVATEGKHELGLAHTRERQNIAFRRRVDPQMEKKRGNRSIAEDLVG